MNLPTGMLLDVTNVGLRVVAMSNSLPEISRQPELSVGSNPQVVTHTSQFHIFSLCRGTVQPRSGGEYCERNNGRIRDGRDSTRTARSKSQSAASVDEDFLLYFCAGMYSWLAADARFGVDPPSRTPRRGRRKRLTRQRAILLNSENTSPVALALPPSIHTPHHMPPVPSECPPNTG